MSGGMIVDLVLDDGSAIAIETFGLSERTRIVEQVNYVEGAAVLDAGEYIAVPRVSRPGEASRVCDRQRPRSATSAARSQSTQRLGAA